GGRDTVFESARRERVELNWSKLVEAGRSPEELAKEFEPSTQTIRNWVNKLLPIFRRVSGRLRDIMDLPYFQHEKSVHESGSTPKHVFSKTLPTTKIP